MDCNHDEQPPELTLIEGLKEDLAWVAGAGAVALACWLFFGDDDAYLLVLPVLAAVYFAVKTIWRRLTHTPRRRRRIGWKTIFWSVAAGVVISVVLGFVWESSRDPGSGSEAADPPNWLVTVVRNSPLAPPCSSTEEIEYVEVQTEILEQLGPAAKRVNELFNDLPSGKLDLQDEEWQRQASMLFLDMEELGESLGNYDLVPDSLERTDRAMADIGQSLSDQAEAMRLALQEIYDGNRFAALGYLEKARRYGDDYEDSLDVMRDRLAEECELDSETP